MIKYLIGALALLVAVLIFFKFSKSSVEGNWQATLIVDNHQDTLALDLSSIQLLIQESTYTFNSTLNVTEIGRFEHTAEHIVLYPSTGQNPYKLQIIHLDDQSLVLDMNNAERSRRIQFKRME